MIVDRTRERVDIEAALFQAKPKMHWNPLWYVWTGWEHFAYFWAPPNNCVYCWLLRLFIIGGGIGAVAAHWWWK